jgi:Xaa-Pro aminopeptidase
MSLADKLIEIQANLISQGISGWLFYDFRHSNPLVYTVLEIALKKMTSRRFVYWLPAKGEPIKIVPQIEPHTLEHLPGTTLFYRRWEEFERLLIELVAGKNKVAMEYSPFNALPIVSKVDAGTVDLIRRAGAEVVSSADLLQRYTSIWGPEQYMGHLASAQALDEIVSLTWEHIGSSLAHEKTLTEYDVQQFMLQKMHASGCETDDPPTCAVNVHSADPHFCPVQHGESIKRDDFILLDLWCKQKRSGAVYADITRVGVAGKKATAKQQEIFECVKRARDSAIRFIQERYENGLRLEGWEVDQVAREEINRSGYGEWFIHRTGHNLGEQVHGPGANLDNFETYDYRELIAGTAFTIEPGIYLPDQFGVRLEYDVYLHPDGKVTISGGIQEEIMTLSS